MSAVLAPVLELIALAFAVAPLTDETSSALAPSDWQAIRAAHADARHAIEARGEAHTAFNHAQNLSVRFEAGSAHLEHAGGGASIDFTLERWGRADALTEAGDELAARAAGRRFERDFTGGLVEWWHNHDRGLEHGFTLATRPSGSGELVVDIAFTTALTPTVDANARGLSIRDASGAVQLTYSGLVAFDSDGDHFQARLELVDDVLRIAVDDTNADYPLTIDPLVQQAFLKPPRPFSLSIYNSSVVAMHGDWLAWADPRERSAATGINGDLNDTSAPFAGAVYVFKRTGSTWALNAYIKASNTDAGDTFGSSLALWNDTLVVGASEEDSSATGVNGDQNDDSVESSGAVYVFTHNGTAWSQQAYLKASHSTPLRRFGDSVAIHEDRLVVGGGGDRSSATGVDGDPTSTDAVASGAAHLFVRQGGVWSEQAYFKASNTESGDGFGRSVALFGDVLAIGAPHESSPSTGVDGAQGNGQADAGAVYVFTFDGVAWSQDAYVKASNTPLVKYFGSQLALHENTLVVGVPNESSNGKGIDPAQVFPYESESGATYVFDRQGGAWSQSAFLKAANSQAGDHFGASVALWGDRLAVGANGEDSAAVGVNGSLTSNAAPGSGAVHVFERFGSAWSQVAFVKASNNDIDDAFGSSVALHEDTLAVLAPLEDSASASNPSDDSISGSGAVYVHDVDLDWTLATGCASNSAAWRYPFASPNLGSTVQLQLFTSDFATGTNVTFVGAAGWDTSGCGVLLAPNAEALLAASPVPSVLAFDVLDGGRALVDLAIPALPSLAGAVIVLQSVAIDTSATMLEFSSALEFELLP